MSSGQFEQWQFRAMLEGGLNPEDAQRFTIDTFEDTPENHSAREAVISFMESFCVGPADGKYSDALPFLLLHGPAGVGKTHLCMAIALCFIDYGHRVLYRHTEKLFGDLRSSMGSLDPGSYSRLVNSVTTWELAIIDDIGVENDTKWAMSQLDMIVDERYRFRRPTVLTTNTLDLPARVADRMKEGMIRQITGPSWRGRGK